MLILSSDFGCVSNILTLPSIIYVSKQTGGFKPRHSISVKCSRYRDTGPTDPSLLHIIGIKDIFECFMMVLNYRSAEY